MNELPETSAKPCIDPLGREHLRKECTAPHIEPNAEAIGRLVGQ